MLLTVYEEDLPIFFVVVLGRVVVDGTVDVVGDFVDGVMLSMSGNFDVLVVM